MLTNKTAQASALHAATRVRYIPVGCAPVSTADVFAGVQGSSVPTGALATIDARVLVPGTTVFADATVLGSPPRGRPL